MNGHGKAHCLEHKEVSADDVWSTGVAPASEGHGRRKMAGSYADLLGSTTVALMAPDAGA